MTPWRAHAGAGSWQDLWPHGEEPSAAAGEKHEEGGAAVKLCYGLTTAPIPHPPVLLRGEGREVGSEGDPRKKEELGGSCF